MQPWPDPHFQAGSQAPQASDRPECKDEAVCDDRCTKSVVSVANKRGSAQLYSSLGSAGKGDQNRLQPASIRLRGSSRSSCHQEAAVISLATGRPCLICSTQCMASLIARRTAALSCSNKAQPSKSAMIVGLAVATVLHRKLCFLSNCLMRLNSNSICQRA